MKIQIQDAYFGTIILVAMLACSIVTPGETEPPAPATDLVTMDPTSTVESTSLSAQRDDGARKIEIALDGSLQNPAWSPESVALVFTRFAEGYNAEPADLFVIDLGSGETRVLVSDGSGNINLPGSTWNSVTHEIVFS